MNRQQIMRLLKNEKGSLLVLVAAGMLLLIGMSALVIDVGFAIREKQKLDNAVDAAALAGIYYIDNQERAFQTAADYLQSNLHVTLEGPVTSGADATFQDSADPSAVIHMEVGDDSLLVTYEKDTPLTFARVFGQDVWGIRAKAKALRAPVSKVKGVIPYGVQEGNYNYGQQYVIEGDTFDSTSYFGLLDLPYINTADSLEYDSFNKCIQNYQETGTKSLNQGLGNTINKYTVCGYPDMLAIGDQVEKKMGATIGQVTDYVQWRIDESNKIEGCKDGQFPGEGSPCLRTALLPIIQVLDNTTVKIVGFSSFWIDKIEGNGSNQKIYGRFIENNTISADSDIHALDHGTYAVKLVE